MYTLLAGIAILFYKTVKLLNEIYINVPYRVTSLKLQKQSHFPLLLSISADYSFGFMHPGLTVNYMNYMWTKKTVDHHSLICLSYNPEIMDEWKQWIDIDIQIQRGPS